MDIMFRCNHVCKKVVGYGDITWVLRGQFISSNYKLAESWGWSESSVRKFIKLLEKDSMLIVKANSKFTLYEVTNYCVYQSADISETQPIPNAQKTHKKRTPHAPRTPNNNDNNYKELKEVINIYTNDPALNESLQSFLEMRIKKKKVPTEHALQLIFKTLDKHDIITKIQMVNKSVVNGWTDVYKPKDYNQQSKPKGATFDDVE